MSIIIKSKEQQHQEDLIRLANFRPIDDDFMQVLLKDDLPLAQEILRIILQKDDYGAASKRARYHFSAMDIENLKAGQEFEELPVTYTIFITENDVFGGNKAVSFFHKSYCGD